MSANIQFKRGTALTFHTINPILLKGEPGLETDTNKIKYGDGVTPWRDLPYGNPAIELVDGGEFVAPALTPTPGTFSPLSISGLALWMDGTNSDYVHVVNNRLSVWEDMSENRHRFVQSNRSNRPSMANQIEAQDVVTFDGGNDVMLSNLGLPAEFTMLVAFKRRGNSTDGHLISARSLTDTNNVVLCGTETGNEFGVKIGTTYYATQPVDDLVSVVYTLQSSASGFSTRLNGLNTQAETAAISGLRSHFALGGSRVDFTENNFGGDIAEIVMYDRILSANELLDAEDYMMSRWGVSQVVHPLLDGMKAFWPLNEESGTRTDITDAAVELASTGDVAFEAGVIGNAAKFTGGANYLTAPNTLTLDGTFSVSLWFKTPSITGSASQIIQNWAAGTAGQMVVGFGDEGGDTSSVWAYVRTANDNYRVSATALEANRWYHFVLVFDSTSNKLLLYIDGVLATQTATTGALVTSNIPLRVGIGEQTTSPNTAAFWLDQLGIWDRVLTLQEVQMLYNYELGKEDFTADLYGENVSLLLHMDKPANAVGSGGGGGSSTLATGLEAFWKFDDLTDMTGNGYTLENIGGATFTPGLVGNALTIDANYGLQDVRISNFKVLRSAGFSISGWVKSNNTYELTTPWVMSHGTAFGFCNGSMVTLGAWEFGAGNNPCNGAGSTAIYIAHPDAPGAYLDGNWHHVVGTFDGATGTANFYVDNVLIGTQNGVTMDDSWPVPDTYFGSGMAEYPRTGQTDSVGYWTRALTEAEIAELYNNGNGKETFGSSSVVPLNGLQAFWKFDDTTDSSGNNYALTNYNNATFTPGKIGNAATFDGTNYFRAAVTQPTTAVTLATWVYLTDINPGQGACLIDSVTGNNWGGGGLQLDITPAGNVVVNASWGNEIASGNSPEDSSMLAMSTATLSMAQWHHVAGTFDTATNTWKIYINGVLESSTTFSPKTGPFGGTGENTFGIGSNGDGTWGLFIGQMDGAGIWNRALTDAEIAGMYNGGTGTETIGTPSGPEPTNIVEPPFDNVALLLHMDGDFSDSSKNNLPIAATNATISTIERRWGSASGYFDGTSYLSHPADPRLELGGADFTVEAWLYWDGNVTGIPGGTIDGLSWAQIFGAHKCFFGGDWLVLLKSDGTLYIEAGGLFSGGWRPAATLPINAWTHFALVRKGAELAVYINGVKSTTTQSVSGSLYSSWDLGIGADSITPGGYFHGYIDDFRMTIGTAVYTGNFTPVGGPHPDPVSNPALLVNFENGIADSSLNTHTVTNNFNVASISPAVIHGTGFDSVGDFDGLGAYLSIPDSPEFDLSSGPFCIELWFYALGLGADLNSAQVLISKDHYGVSFSWAFHVSATQIRVPTANIAGDWDFLVNQSVTNYAWHHIAVTGDGSTMKMFFDGNLIGTKNRTLTNAAADVTIGCGSYNNPNAFFYGRIDDVRIVKGAQVYTDTFTPPAVPHPVPRSIPPAIDPYSNNVALMLNMNGSDGSTTFTDSSNNALTLVAEGNAQITTTQSKFGGASLSLSGGRLVSSSAVINDLSGSDFTVEAWVWRPAGTGNSAIINIAQQLTTNGVHLWVDSTGTVQFDDGTQPVASGGPVPDEQWTHIAGVRNNGNWQIYINGIAVGSPVFGTPPSGPYYIYVGSHGVNDFYSNMLLDDLRVTIGVARYTTNFYPPVGQFAITQSGGGGGGSGGLTATLLLHMDGNSGSDVFTDESANALVPTVNGTTVSTTQSKFGGASAYFDGNNVDTLVYADSPLFGFGTGDFTIEMFTYRVAGGSRASVISVGTYQTGILWRLNESNTDNLYLNVNVTNTAWNWQAAGSNGPGGVVPQNAWAHIALTRQGTIVRVFVDGVMAFEADVGTVDLGASQPLTIGTGAHEFTSTDAYYGYIDELRIIKGTAVYTADFTPPTEPFSASGGGGGGGGGGTGPVAVFIDTSKHNHAVTPVGNAVLNLTDIKYGNASGEFTGGHCTIPMSPEFALADGDFTVEFWGKLNYTQNAGVFSTASSAQEAGTYLIGFRNDANMFGFCYDIPNFTFVSADISAYYADWAHYAFVRLDGVLKMYVNGVQVATANTTVNLNSVVQTNAVVGRRWTDVDDHYLDGLIDDFRITKGVARYIANFNPPTKAFPDPLIGSTAPPASGDPYAEYVTLMLSLDGANGSTTFTDYSYLQNVVTAEGSAQISTAQSKFGGASAYFDGSGVLNTAETALNFGADDFTIEMWLQLTGTADGQCFLTNGYGINNSIPGGILVYWDGLSNYLRFYASSDGASWDISSGIVITQAAAVGSWGHVAVSRSSGVIRTFWNGVAGETVTSSAAPSITGLGCVIGANSSTCHIDDLRITSGVARYTSNFTPPTVPHPKPFEPAPTATLLLHFDGSYADVGKNALTFTPAGGATLSTTQSKFGGSSAYFDGQAGTMLSAPSSADFAFDGDFTVEAWVYRTGNGTVVGGNAFAMIATGLGGGDATGWTLFISDGININFLGSTGGGWQTVVAGPATIPLNQWCHIAAIRAGTAVKIFVDGVETVTGTSSDSIVSGTNLYIGSYPLINGFAQASFEGYIDEVRIIKGTAVYADDFTPPTAPFFATSNVTPTDIIGCDLWLDSTAPITEVNGAIATWPDKSGNGRTATPADYAPAPVVASAAGPNGQDVVRFSGDPNVLDISYQFNLKNSSGFVLLRHAANITTGTYGRFLSFQPTNGFDYAQVDGLAFSTNQNNPTGIGLYSNNLGATHTMTLPLGWTFLSYTIDENGLATLRVDGAEVASTAFTGIAATAGGNLYIGHGGQFGIIEALQGDIAEISLFDHKLGPAALVGLEQSVLKRWLPPPTNNGQEVLRMHFDGADGSTTFTDSSTNGLVVSAFGAVSITSTQSRFGNSAQFNGNGDRLEIATNPLFDLSGGDYTIEFFFNITDWSGWDYARIYTLENDTGSIGVLVANDESGTIMINRYGGPPTLYSAPGRIAQNTWHHVAVVKYNGLVSLYVDGSSNGFTLIGDPTSTFVPAGANKLVLGGSTLNCCQYTNFKGYIDDFRIVKGAALYTTNFPVPNLPVGSDLKLLLHMDGADGSGTFTDSSLNNTAITVTGATITTAESKFGGASGYFNGGATLTGPDLALGTDRFTMELWFKAENGGGPQYATLFANYKISDLSSGFGLYYNNNGAGAGGIGLYSLNSICATVDTYADGLWHHVAVTRDGATCNLFVDGLLAGTGSTSPANRSFSSPDGFMIGGSPEVGYRLFQGWIDDFRVVKGTVLYTDNFTPPTAPLPNPPTFPPVVLMHFDGPTLVDSSPTGLTFNTTTLGAFDASIKKFGDSAYSYNGANDIYSTTRGVPDLTTGNFTVECWVYRPTIGPSYATVLFLHASADNLTYSGGLHLAITQAGAVECNNGFSAALTGGNAPVGAWTHLAVVRTGTTSTLYVNGVSVNTNTQLPVAGPYILCFGSVPTAAGFESDLIIDELRISKTAIYTGNFTPPTAPFTP